MGHFNCNQYVYHKVPNVIKKFAALKSKYYCNLFQIRKSFFAELGFYENDTLVRIMYEDFIKGTMDADERDKAPPETDPKRAAFYDVRY